MDTRLHNDCDGGNCVTCYMDERRAKGRRCDTCYWWLRDRQNGDGICRRYRPSHIKTTPANFGCGEHSFERPMKQSEYTITEE